MTTRTSWMAVPETHPVAGMNATPLIDVLLVLLVMFIITVPIMTHVVKLDMPISDHSNVVPPVVHVEIEYGGAIAVNGRELDVAALERYFKSLREQALPPEIRVHTSDRAKYERFAQVIAIAQRNGLQRITVSGGHTDP